MDFIVLWRSSGFYIYVFLNIVHLCIDFVFSKEKLPRTYFPKCITTQNLKKYEYKFLRCYFLCSLVTIIDTNLQTEVYIFVVVVNRHESVMTDERSCDIFSSILLHIKGTNAIIKLIIVLY